MNQKQKLFHKSLVRSIHLSRKYREYFKDNRDEYVELLQKHFGVSSSKELNIDQLISFVDFMNLKRVALPTHRNGADAPCTHAQLSMMRGLWKDFATTQTDEALLKFANRQAKKSYTRLHMVTLGEAQKIIPVLETMKKNIIIVK